MRISYDYGAIFLANPKCASNTVERYLRAHTRDARGLPGYIRHLNARGLDEFMDDQHLEYDDFLVFTTVRNPWDRMVSLWAYAKERVDSAWHDAAMSTTTFSDFLRTKIVEVDFVRNFGLYGFTHTADGRCTVDDTMCIERLAVELPVMFRRIGLEFVDARLHDNRSARDGYRDYYNDADRKFVEELFAYDVEFGKYSF
jgi:hypothetical protein